MTTLFAQPPDMPKSSLITTPRFAEVYAAAEFAWFGDLPLDAHVILNWSAMGISEMDVPEAFQKFTKGMREFLTQRHWPSAWIYGHETSVRHGLHTHIAVCLPVHNEQHRSESMQWIREFPLRQLGRRVKNAIRLRVPRANHDLFLHWLLFHYIVKGYDPTAVVQSGRNSPDGKPIMLGDLIAFTWRDPGIVQIRKRVGFSQSLGPAEQLKGVPGASTFNKPVAGTFRISPTDPISFSLPTRSEPPFRSTFDDAVFDVRRLYGQDFCDRVNGVRRLLEQ